MTLLNTGGHAAKRCGPVAQIIPNRLYFASFDRRPQDDAQVAYYWLNGDENIHYDAFYDDFGPLNLSVLFRFCQSLNNLLKTEQRKKIFVAVDATHRNRVNGAYLVASYMIIYHKLTADQAYLRVQALEPPKFIGFRDAALGPPSYLLHLQNVIKAVERALHHSWFDFDSFDATEYEYYERVENGDFNWILPGKVLSFCGPHKESSVENGYPYHAPEVYFDYFKKHNVTTIIRLNKKMYDARKFTDAGFAHHDLFFVDGSTPSEEIVKNFISIVEQSPGAVAVHCKAGLGRTGTLIGCWMMKKFKLTAPQCMAWMRICRPGSVIGPQQHFLIEKQAWCWRLESDSLGLPQPNLRQPQTTATPKEEGGAWNKEAEKKKKAAHSPLPAVTLMESESLDAKTPVSGSKQSKRSEDVPSAATPNTGDNNALHIYPLRSRLSGANIAMEMNGNPDFDETATNERGQTQGDRLNEIKAKAQRDKPSRPLSYPQRLSEPLVPLGSGAGLTTPTKTTAPTAHPRFSSETTPIKQMKFSSLGLIGGMHSVFKTGPPQPFPPYRNINFEPRMPVSKVSVESNSSTRPSVLRGNLGKQRLANARNTPYLTTVQHHTTAKPINSPGGDALLNLPMARGNQFLANATPPKHLMATNSSVGGTIAAAAISIAGKRYGLRPRNSS